MTTPDTRHPTPDTRHQTPKILEFVRDPVTGLVGEIPPPVLEVLQADPDHSQKANAARKARVDKAIENRSIRNPHQTVHTALEAELQRLYQNNLPLALQKLRRRESEVKQDKTHCREIGLRSLWYLCFAAKEYTHFNIFGVGGRSSEAGFSTANIRNGIKNNLVRLGFTDGNGASDIQKLKDYLSN
jgi:hypothetical protein